MVVGVSGCFGQDTNRIYINDDVELNETDEFSDIQETDMADELDDLGDEDINASETLELDMPVDGEAASEPAQSENIIVQSPLPNSTVSSPFEVEGMARVFEGTILVRVVNQDGKKVIPEQIVNVHSAEQGEFGAFRIKINYQFYATKEGVIEVFSQSAEDRSEINMVEIPVKFE